MLNFILGRSGSGKTHYIKEKLSQLVKNGVQNLYLIVPEQSSYTAERAILEALGEKFARNIEIVSFTRLVNAVLRITGGISGRRISAGEKQILMASALEETAEFLNVYKDKAKLPEMVLLMLKTAERLKLCSVSSDELLDVSGKVGDKLFRDKLKDTALIFDTYKALVSKSYIDPSDDMERLYKELCKYPFFKGSTVFIDGFSGFTKGELDVIEQIITQSDECYISLCLEKESRENKNSGKFALTYDTYLGICNILKKNGLQIGEIITLEPGKRYLSKELAFAEEHIFSADKAVYDGMQSNIKLFRAKNIYEECDFISAEIRRLVTEENYRYRDIVLISRSSDAYKGVLDTALDKYGIPYFADLNQTIDTCAVMILALSLLDTVNNSFNTDCFMRILKTGLTNITCEEVSELENYILMWNIKGSELQKDFTYNPMGFGSEQTDESDKLLSRLNDIRKRAVDPLLKFKSEIKDASALKISRAIYCLLEEIGAKNALIKNIKTLNETQAKMQEKLWEILLHSLDYMAYVFSDREINPKRYAQLLHLVINSADIGSIPKGFDTVTFGTADRIRTDSPKAVFLLGANDGEFPMPPQHDSLFSNAECALLSDMGLKLYDDVSKLTNLETFFAYTALSTSREKLYVSYSQSQLMGDAKKPSVIVSELKRMFPSLEEHCIDDYSPEDLLWAEKPAFDFLALSEEHSRVSVTLRKYFSESETYKKKLSAIDKIKHKEPLKIEDSKIATELFGKDMYISPSQVERYHLCPFSFFCMYGLKAKERKKAELNYPEYGSLVHSILENIFIKNAEHGIGTLDYEQIKEEVYSLASEYIEKYMGGLDDKTPRFKQLCLNLCENVVQLAEKLSQEFKHSSFKPDAFEMEISKKGDIPPYTVDMPDGTKVNIIGKIDRVDTYSHDGKTYLRVVDYKTGSKEFVLADIIHGLNMQMLLYLSALYKNGGIRYDSPVPAGILYMPASIKSVTVLPDTQKEEALSILSDNLRMNGLLIDNYDVLKAMEDDLKGRYIPVILSKLDENGEPVYKNRESLVTDDELAKIFKSIDLTLIAMAQDLKDGRIDKMPVKGAFDACKYCSYISVCGYEETDKSRCIKRGKRGEIPQSIIGGGENINER